jgi:NADP-dependent 3-hydroxy acid dehydrogenase YdfG
MEKTMPGAENKIAKKALVTGASSGLGRAVAAVLIGSGVNVVAVSRTRPRLDCLHIKTDLTLDASIARTLRQVRKKHADCDLLVQCAGVLHWNNAGETPRKQIDADCAVNLIGMMKIADGLMPIISKNNGDIVIVGSTSSFNTPPGSSVYCAAKHGVLGYIKALQAECRNRDVRIIGIHPGGFKSQLHIKAGTRIGRSTLMDPEDIARLIVSLIALPRNMEVSEIIINRKVVTR